LRRCRAWRADRRVPACLTIGPVDSASLMSGPVSDRSRQACPAPPGCPGLPGGRGLLGGWPFLAASWLQGSSGSQSSTGSRGGTVPRPGPEPAGGKSSREGAVLLGGAVPFGGTVPFGATVLLGGAVPFGGTAYCGRVSRRCAGLGSAMCWGRVCASCSLSQGDTGWRGRPGGADPLPGSRSGDGPGARGASEPASDGPGESHGDEPKSSREPAPPMRVPLGSLLPPSLLVPRAGRELGPSSVIGIRG
jgi:hypothetical protein